MAGKTEIKSAIDQLLDSKEPEKIAVFDADGTLWHDDLGEAFFKYQIQNHLAPGIHRMKDPWQHYENLKLKGHLLAYGWLAQINAKIPEKVLKSQCENFYKRQFKPGPIEEMRSLIKELTQHQ